MNGSQHMSAVCRTALLQHGSDDDGAICEIHVSRVVRTWGLLHVVIRVRPSTTH